MRAKLNQYIGRLERRTYIRQPGKLERVDSSVSGANSSVGIQHMFLDFVHLTNTQNRIISTMSTPLPSKAPIIQYFDNLLHKVFKRLPDQAQQLNDELSFDSSEDLISYTLTDKGVYFTAACQEVDLNWLDKPITYWMEENDIRISSEDVFLLCRIIPQNYFSYVERVYLNRGRHLIDGALPCFEILNVMDAELDPLGHGIDFDLPFVVNDNMPVNYTEETTSTELIIEDEFDEDPYSTDEEEFDQDVLMDDAEIDEAYDNVFNYVVDRSSVHESVSSDLSEQQEKPGRKSLSQNQEIPRYQRSGPKQRGSGRCNNNNKRRVYKPKEKDPISYANLRRMKQMKKIEKMKLGKEWKQPGATRHAKDAKLLSQAFHLQMDQKIAKKIAKIETLQTNLENKMNPDPYNEFYTNASAERKYLEEQIDRENKEYKKKEYERNEWKVNKSLAMVMDAWRHEDYCAFGNTSNFVEDLTKVEEFLKANIDDSETVNTTVEAVARVIETKQNLMDKCSNFLKDLILRVKPLAFGADCVRDVALNVNILKDQSEVFLGNHMTMGEWVRAYDAFNKDYVADFQPDLRDDHMRRGDLIHKDPLLRECVIRRTTRDGLLSNAIDKRCVISCELLFQLMSPSVCKINAPVNEVYYKMVHIASNITTINIPKDSFSMFNTEIVDDTLIVAKALFETRRRASLALGFPIASV